MNENKNITKPTERDSG